MSMQRIRIVPSALCSLRRPALALLALLVLLVGAPRLASAADAKAVKKIEDMNKKAMESFDALEFEAAKKQLGQALVEIKKLGLDKDKVAAQTHGRLALVYDALGDSDNALLEFIAALEIDPSWTIPKAYKTPQLDKIFANAKSTVGTTGTPTPSGGDILSHVPVEEAPQGKTLIITATTGSAKVKQVTLAYRPEGKDSFTQVAMTQAGDDWEGTVPAAQMRGGSVQYYLEAKGSGGKVLAASGSDDSPHIVSITGGKKPPGDDPPPDDPPPDDPPPDDDKKRPVAKKAMFLAFGGGTALGIPTGNAEVSGQKIEYTGGPFLNEPAHVSAEIGFFLSPHSALSAMFRMGLPLGSNIPGASPAAPSFWVRFYYLFGDYGGFNLHADVGAGVMRHTVKLGPGDQRFEGKTDAVASGPAWIGGGAGYLMQLNGTVSLFADTTIQSVVPVTKSGFGTKLNYLLNFELTVGLRLAF
jgi:hypothetical protein